MKKVAASIALLAYLIGIALWLTGHLSNQNAAVVMGAAGVVMAIITLSMKTMKRTKAGESAKSDPVKMRDGE